MTTVQIPTKSLQRVHGRGLLLSILEKDIILTKIKVCDNGRFTVETKNWNAYWQPAHELGHEKVEEALNTLYSAWRDYIGSGVGATQRQEFCYRYFSLLDILLSFRLEFPTQAWLHALHSVLGFECFGIASATAEDKVLAAGTCTLRNPCYLLAKLKMPDVLDDPQFLPVITVASPEKPELFYHYRQYTISRDSPMSLLIYPAVSEAKRSTSFKLLNAFAGGIRYASDPWTSERAEQIYQGIIRVIIQATKPVGTSAFRMEFVDVGAGSGSLISRLCRHIQKAIPSTEFNTEFRLWSVDLETADPVRFFRARELRNSIDSLMYIGDDYRDWLSRSQPLPAKNGLRIALLSKLFNTMSRFEILYLSPEKQFSRQTNASLSEDFNASLPAHCLASDGKGAKVLAISNSRLILPEGKTFAQASLSDYYRGLYLLSRQTDSGRSPEEGLFLPVRTFNPECLTTKDGKSVISCLSENCDYVIIEDADLKPQDLIAHATKFLPNSMSIYDMTKALRLKGNYLYVIWAKNIMNPPFSGEQIW